MRYITSNLYFAAFMILAVGRLLWFVFNDQPKKEKNAILSRFTDLILLFVGLLFGVNMLFHFQEIINFPYRVLLFSSRVIGIATFALTIYSTMKFGRKLLNNPMKALAVSQLLILLGLVNHLYLYVLYRNLRPLLFIAFFIGLLLFTTDQHKSPKVDGLLSIGIVAISHFMLMGNKPIVYFNFTFYPLPLLIISLTLIGILFTQRRNHPSKRN